MNLEEILFTFSLAVYEGIGFFFIYYTHALRNILGYKFGAYSEVCFSQKDGIFYGTIMAIIIIILTLSSIDLAHKLIGVKAEIFPSIYFFGFGIFSNILIIVNIQPFEIQLVSGIFLLIGIGAASLFIKNKKVDWKSTNTLEIEHKELLQIFQTSTWGTAFILGAVIAPIIFQWLSGIKGNIFSIPIGVKMLLLLKLWDSIYFAFGIIIFFFLPLYQKMCNVKLKLDIKNSIKN